MLNTKSPYQHYIYPNYACMLLLPCTVVYVCAYTPVLYLRCVYEFDHVVLPCQQFV